MCAAAAATAIGLFGAVISVADAFTHFRMHLALAALVLAVLTLPFDRRWATLGLVTAVAIFLLNIAIDLLYAFLDPRIRY